MRQRCEYKGCDKPAVGWGILEGVAGEDSIDPDMPTATMAPLCQEHIKK